MQNCVSQTPFAGSCPLQKWQATQTLVLLKDGIKVGPHDLEKLFCLQGNSKISHTALFQTQASKSNKRKLQHQDVRNESDDWSNAPFQSSQKRLSIGTTTCCTNARAVQSKVATGSEENQKDVVVPLWMPMRGIRVLRPQRDEERFLVAEKAKR